MTGSKRFGIFSNVDVPCTTTKFLSYLENAWSWAFPRYSVKSAFVSTSDSRVFSFTSLIFVLSWMVNLTGSVPADVLSLFGLSENPEHNDQI